MVQALNLVPDEAYITRPMDDGEPVSNEEIPLRMLRWLAEQTAFLSNDQGWEASGNLAPWNRIRRDKRTFRVVLEPYVWIWDRRTDTTSPFVELPDADTDPVACWRELARRLERLSELLGIPWSTSPGSTGESLFSADPVGPGTGHETPARTRRTRRTEGRPDPDRRRAAAGHPAAAGTTAPGMGVPVPPGDRQDGTVQGHRAADLRPAGQLPVLRRRHRPGLRPRPAPGPGRGDRRRDRRQDPEGEGPVRDVAGDIACVGPEVTAAAPGPAPLREGAAVGDHPHPDPAAGGRGHRRRRVRPHRPRPDRGARAAVPGRLLEPWYARCRDALLTARADGDEAIARAVKGVYTGYIGRMASDFTRKGAQPWHHQPMWGAAIRAAARAALWRVIQKHRLATGRIPIAIEFDEIGYLGTDPDPRVNAPAADNGRLGALKSAGYLELTDELRRRATKGESLLDKSLRRRQFSAEIEGPATAATRDS